MKSRTSKNILTLAANMLEEHAQTIANSYTIFGGKWGADREGRQRKREYLEHLSTAKRLREISQKLFIL